MELVFLLVSSNRQLDWQEEMMKGRLLMGAKIYIFYPLLLFIWNIILFKKLFTYKSYSKIFGLLIYINT